MRSFKNTYYDIKRHHNHLLKFLNSSISFINITNVQKRLKIRGENAYDNLLTDWENSYINKIKIPKRKTDFLSGRLAGKRAVKRHFLKNNYADIVKKDLLLFNDIEIKRTVTGRPLVFIKDGASKNGSSDFLISISHTQGVAASLVCYKKDCKGIGIDIEKIEEKDSSLMDVAFTDYEKQILQKLISRENGRENVIMEEEIARYWSIKEAVMKSLGIGVNIDLKDIEVTDIEEYNSSVQLLNEAEDRFKILEGVDLKVESTKIEGFMISIACLY